MKKLKVIHFVSGLKAGGVESMIINYAGLLQEEFEFTVVYQHNPDRNCMDKMIKAGCILKRIPSKKRHPVANLFAIKKIFTEEKYDIVHSHMNLTSWIPLMIAKWSGIKCRVNHSHIAKNEGDGVLYYIFSYISKCLIKHYGNYFLACGEDAANYMYGTVLEETQNVTIINNAIDINKFKYCEDIRMQYREELQLNDKYVIGHIGRFTEQKNHFFLIDFFEKVVQDVEDAVLLLVGSGELFEKVMLYADKKNISSKVIFLGSRNDIGNLLQVMDVFVLPSLYEGLPVVAIEAQASGVDCLFANTIDEKSKIINRTLFLPIDQGGDLWSKHIVQKKCMNDRLYAWKEVQKSGYDIEIESEKLKSFYFKIMKEG